MTIATFPAITANNAEFGLQCNTQTSRSELNGTIQTLSLPGDIWVCNETFTNKFDPDARILRAFLTSLRGEAGRFYKSPPGYKRTSTASGTPLVKGASQTGLSLITDGWAVSSTVLLAGEYFQVGNELKMITTDATSNSSGESTLQFTPPLRAVPIDNAAIIVDNPACVMKLKDGNQARWQAQPTPIYNLSIASEEALDIT